MPELKNENLLGLIESSGLFDKQWYLSKYPDVAKSNIDPIEHYILYGAALGRDPSSNFNTSAYIETVNYLKELETKGIKVIYNTYNYGFSYAVNQGVTASNTASDILLLNNDAVLTKGALERLQVVTYSHESIAISVPQQVLESSNPAINTHVPYADSIKPCDVTLSAHHDNVQPLPLFHNGELVELNFAPFFCAYIKRDVWGKCGGLDAEKGRHYRSDRIMCEYIRHILGMKIVYTPKAVVHHIQSL